MVGTPLALLMSVIGLLVDRNKKPSLIALLLAGAAVAFFLTMALCS